jgi:hypothetical protein
MSAVKREISEAAQRVSAWGREPVAPPAGARPLDLVLYGLAQPLWGLRTVLRDRGLLGLAIAPVLLVAAVCAATAWAKAADAGPVALALAFFAAFTGLAAVPPILFQRTYARLAARAQNELGFGPREPYLRTFGEALWESIAQLLVIAIGIAPLTAVLGFAPGVGAAWAAGAQALWTLHWIVVEAFDSARTLAPGESVAAAEKAGATRPGRPWFARLVRRDLPFPLGLGLLPFRICGGIAAGLSTRWRPEVDRIEAHPWVATGFGLGTALLLGIPGINLFFRPAIVLGAAHLAGRLDAPVPALHGPSGTQPYPTLTGTAPYPAVHTGPTGTAPWPALPTDGPESCRRT